MSKSMFNMWVSIGSMALLFLAFVTIYFSRYKLKKGFLKVIATFLAYVFLIVGSILMVYIVLGGPTS